MTKLIKRLRSKKRGFTLVELIVVIAILAILAAILVPTMLGVLEDSRKSVREANAKIVYSAAHTAYVSVSTKNLGDFTKTSFTKTEILDADTEPAADASADAVYAYTVNQNLAGSDIKGEFAIAISDGKTTVEYWDSGDKPTGTGADKKIAKYPASSGTVTPPIDD